MRGDTDDQSSSSSSTASPSRPTNGALASPLRKAALSNVLNGAATDANGSGPQPPATNNASGSDPAPNTFFGHNREEVVRIMIQGLNDLGYTGSANMLAGESGFQVETVEAATFRWSIHEGEWAHAEALVLGHSSDPATAGAPHTGKPLELADGVSREEMLFMIRRQKYLELLEQRDLGQALGVLRSELQPLRQNERALHALSSLIMYQSADELKQRTGWDGAGGESRKQLYLDLSKSISPSAMIPQHRLAGLLTQFKDAQASQCLYHNSPHAPSLLTDHRCDEHQFPRDAIATMEDHKDEVWYLQFSHDGTRLATASKDHTARIYDTDTFALVHTLSGHSDSVTYIVWSPDDRQLITCSQDACFRIWDTAGGRCLRTVKQGAYPVTTAAWAPDGASFVTGSQDVGCPMAIWELQDPSAPVFNFERAITRVLDCALTGPAAAATAPARLVAICSIKTVHVFDWARREKLCQLRIEQDLTSISLSPDGREMLVNLGSTKEIWAMAVETCEVLHKYRGQAQGQFVIRSAYGGATGGFVVSGGEDAKVTVWHRHSARLLEQFPAHGAGCVNAVAWNLARPEMFASVGDDHKVRVFARPDALLGGMVSQGTSARPSMDGDLPHW